MTTTTFARERTLQDEIAPAVERGVPGVEVLAVELLSPSRFCVYVDHPEGVDHDLCTRVTRLLDAYRADYTIDVSSPGPERPLRKPQHFAGAVGRTVNVRTDRKIAGRNRFKGEVARRRGRRCHARNTKPRRSLSASRTTRSFGQNRHLSDEG